MRYILIPYGLFLVDSLGAPLRFIESDYNLKTFAFDHNNNIHIAGWGWMTVKHSKFNYESTWFPDFRNEISPMDINQITRQKNNMWYASWANGLYVCENDTFKCFNSKNSVLPDIINTICTDNNNNLIAGANNGNIYILDYTRHQLKIRNIIISKNGLLGNTISIGIKIIAISNKSKSNQSSPKCQFVFSTARPCTSKPPAIMERQAMKMPI